RPRVDGHPGRRARPPRRADRGAPPGISERHAGRLLIVILVHAILSDLGRPDGVGEGGDAGGLARAEFERGEAAALAGARAIITTSSWAKNELVDRFALAARSVHVVRPGVDAPVEHAPAEPALHDTGGNLLVVASVT